MRATPACVSYLVAALLWLLSTLALLFAVELPIGSAYRDVVMLLDGAYRVGNGQVPHRDFFVPFGPLPVYALHWVCTLFPSAHPVLAAQYAALWLALPCMAVVASRPSSVERRAQWGVVLVLWGAFAFTALLPANFANFHEPFQSGGISGFGIYNRQAGILLFALLSAVFLGASSRWNGVFSALLTVALLLVKVTALAVALPVVLWSMFARRPDVRGAPREPYVDWRSAGAVLLACTCAGGWLELESGVLGGYARDVRSMAELARGSRMDRLIRAVVADLGIVLFAGCAWLGLAARELLDFFRRPGSVAARCLLASPAAGVGLSISGAAVFESQNTGSQGFAFLVPVLCYVAVQGRRLEALGPRERWAVRFAEVGAVCFIAVIAAQTSKRYAAISRAIVSQPGVAELRDTPLRARASPEDQASAREWLRFYARQRRATEILTEGALRVSFSVGAFYRLDENLVHSLSAVALREDLARFEARHQVHFRSVATLDFVDPAPMLLDRLPVVGLPVVLDPERTVSRDVKAKLRSGLANAELILKPLCGAWRWYGAAYADLAQPVLRERTPVRLSDCWIAYPAKELAFQLGGRGEQGAAAEPLPRSGHP